MKSSLNLVRIAGLAAIATAGAFTASAGGLIGQRHAWLTYNHTNYNSSNFESSGGVTVFANMPVRPEKLDVGFTYSYFDQESAAAALPNRSRKHALAVATFYKPAAIHTSDLVHRPYFRPGVGWAEWKYGPSDVRNGLAYYAEAGAELFYIENVRFTPYVAWVDTVKRETRGDLHYGVRSEISLGRQASILAGLAGDENGNVTVSFGAGVRF